MLHGSRASVLVLDDDVQTTLRIQTALAASGHAVTCEAEQDAALRQVFDLRPDLIVLDVELGGSHGWTLLERLREFCAIPVLVVTRSGNELDTVRALSAGADDYVTKPVGGPELRARVEALLRRSRPQAPVETYDDGFLRIDYARREVVVEGEVVRFTPLEFRLLSTLVRHAGQVLSRDQLLELVWGHTASASGDEVRVYVRYLRRKLATVTTHDAIETVRGFGYTYAAPVPATAVA